MEKRKWNCGEQRLMRDSSWPDCVSLSFEKDRAYGFSWPQRNYRCSFCNKEFKSAQALGGHMNVHRRDRARMKLSPNSWESSSPGITSNSSNPNPNFFPFLSSSAPPKFSSYNMPPSQKSFTTPAAAHLHQENIPVTVDPHDIVAICRGDRENKNKEPAVELTARRKEARVWKTSEFHRLDLNLNLDLIQDGREDLDLELRLGFN